MTGLSDTLLSSQLHREAQTGGPWSRHKSRAHLKNNQHKNGWWHGLRGRGSPSKYKALSSTSSSAKKQKQTNKKNQTKLGVVVHVCNPSYSWGGGRRIVVPGNSQAKVWDPIWRTSWKQKNWGVAQVIECLTSKCEAEFNPQYCKKLKQNKKTMAGLHL
jgi:hypothetical protein